jgi:hypothetical protein
MTTPTKLADPALDTINTADFVRYFELLEEIRSNKETFGQFLALTHEERVQLKEQGTSDATLHAINVFLQAMRGEPIPEDVAENLGRFWEKGAFWQRLSGGSGFFGNVTAFLGAASKVLGNLTPENFMMALGFGVLASQDTFDFVSTLLGAKSAEPLESSMKNVLDAELKSDPLKRLRIEGATKFAETSEYIHEQMFGISRGIVGVGMITLLIGHSLQYANGDESAIVPAIGRFTGLIAVMMKMGEALYLKQLEDPEYTPTDFEKKFITPFADMVKNIYNNAEKICNTFKIAPGKTKEEKGRAALGAIMLPLLAWGGAGLAYQGLNAEGEIDWSKIISGLSIAGGHGLWVTAQTLEHADVPSFSAEEIERIQKLSVLLSHQGRTGGNINPHNISTEDEEALVEDIKKMAEAIAKLPQIQKFSGKNIAPNAADLALAIDMQEGTDLYHKYFFEVRVEYSDAYLDPKSDTYKNILKIAPAEANVVRSKRQANRIEYVLLTFDDRHPMRDFTRAAVLAIEHLTGNHGNLLKQLEDGTAYLKLTPTQIRCLADLIREAAQYPNSEYLNSHEARTTIETSLKKNGLVDSIISPVRGIG